MIDLLEHESDINTRRNAIVLLFKVDHNKALQFLLQKLEDDEMEDFGDTT